MTIPLVILAVMSVIAGFVNVPEVLGGGHWLDNFFTPLLAGTTLILEENVHAHLSHTVEYILMGSSVLAVLAVIFYARIRYKNNGHVPAEDSEPMSFLERLLSKKYYVDELYDGIVSNPVVKGAGLLYNYIEVNFIDRIVNGVGQLVVLSSRTARFMQTGNVGFYIFAMVIGALVILAANTFLH
jgi:NADH-quinone oxidoreductase subunit L